MVLYDKKIGYQHYSFDILALRLVCKFFETLTEWPQNQVMREVRMGGHIAINFLSANE